MNSRLIALLLVVVLGGCSSIHSEFLQPSAPGGDIRRIGGVCPTEIRGLWVIPQDQDWLRIRVYATLPDQGRGNATKLTIEVGKNLKSAWLRNTAENELALPHLITVIAQDKDVTVHIPGQNSRRISLRLLSERKVITRGWIEEELEISPAALDSFSVDLPAIIVNEKTISLPPIMFQKSHETYHAGNC